MNYTLHQLRVFMAVVETESITKAAEKLHLTQPAVSIQIKKLQEQFDVALIEIIGKRLYITDFGKEVAKTAVKILEDVELLRNKTLAFKGNLVGTLKIASASTGKYVMPYFLSEFLAEHPGIDLVMDVTNKRNVIKQLEKNEIDFALVSVLPALQDIKIVPLMDNHLYLVEQGSMAKKKRKEILHRALIYREEGSATRAAMRKYYDEHPQENRKIIELTSNEAVKQAVISGMGQSIMPLIGLRNELKDGDLTIVKAKDLPITTQWHLVYLSQKELSPVATAYLNFLKDNKEDIIKNHFAWVENFI
ncbi:MAG: LysR family transcriptional regulator [Luteibaculum sp.]